MNQVLSIKAAPCRLVFDLVAWGVVGGFGDHRQKLLKKFSADGHVTS